MLTFFYILQFVIAIALILIVMFQKSEGGTGLISSNAYNSFFANKFISSNPLTKITIILGVAFFLNAIVIGALNIVKIDKRTNLFETIEKVKEDNKEGQVPLNK
jgi:protein translocase SecG subunit